MRSIARRVVLQSGLGVLAVRGSAAQGAPAGRIVRSTGAVSITSQTQARTASPGLVVSRGDRVVTGADGRAEISGIDGTTIVIGPGSQVTITQYSASASRARSVLLDLLQGIVRLIVTAAGPGYTVEVRTPTAVASVRSTEWIVDAAADNTGVLAIDGRVEVVGQSGSNGVVLTAGQGTDVRRGATPTPAVPWGAARIQDVLSRTRSP